MQHVNEKWGIGYGDGKYFLRLSDGTWKREKKQNLYYVMRFLGVPRKEFDEWCSRASISHLIPMEESKPCMMNY